MLFTRPVQPTQLQQQLNAERQPMPCSEVWREEECQVPVTIAQAMKIEAHPSKLFTHQTLGALTHG